MLLNEDAQKAVNILGDSINTAVGESGRVADAIENLRAIGYEPYLTLRLEIALDKIEPETAENADGFDEIEMTDEDLRILQKMKIKF